jgi:hypothetical protein
VEVSRSTEILGEAAIRAALGDHCDADDLGLPRIAAQAPTKEDQQ